MKSQHPYLDINGPMIFAHRGDSVHAPANTEPAFRLAVECGADALETDIHWTKDGEIVVCHDDTVDAVSDGRGAIKDCSLAELKALDFGYSFTPDGGMTFPYRGKGVQIMTLTELLTTFATIRVNMDVKPKHPRSLRQLIQTIHDCDAQWRVMIASFHSRPLKMLRGLNSRLATSASTEEAAQFWLKSRLGIRSRPSLPYLALQVPLKMGAIQVVTKRFIHSAHAAMQDVHIWTIDDEQEMIYLLELGVDGLVTNNPALAVAVRERWIGSTRMATGGLTWKS